MNTVWVFDVDGVITDPQEKQITQPEILDQIISRLEKEDPVAFVTGRALEWVSERIISQLESRINDSKLLNNFFVSGEFGGSSITYGQGVRKEFINRDFRIDQRIIDEVLELTMQKFPDSMQFDKDKKTMVSIEMKDGLTVEQFKPIQKELTPILKKILINHPGKDLEVQEDLIATNIKNKRANKAFATQQLINWIENKKIKIGQYVAVGDNFKSDVLIAEEIDLEELTVEFVYVGKENIDTSKYSFPIKQTKNKFEKGTLEYLKSKI